MGTKPKPTAKTRCDVGWYFVNLILAWIIYSCLLFFYGTDSISMKELDDGFFLMKPPKTMVFKMGIK